MGWVFFFLFLHQVLSLLKHLDRMFSFSFGGSIGLEGLCLCAVCLILWQFSLSLGWGEVFWEEEEIFGRKICYVFFPVADTAN